MYSELWSSRYDEMRDAALERYHPQGGLNTLIEGFGGTE